MVGASGARPINGRPPDALTIETIVPVTFYEIVKNRFNIREETKGKQREKNWLTGCFPNRTAKKTGSANYFFTGTA
jgi:hypothetical protein